MISSNEAPQRLDAGQEFKSRIKDFYGQKNSQIRSAMQKHEQVLGDSAPQRYAEEIERNNEYMHIALSQESSGKDRIQVRYIEPTIENTGNFKLKTDVREVRYENRYGVWFKHDM